ncbi:MAG: DUF2231 domain-containing protein [Minisyncoccia bacterium]
MNIHPIVVHFPIALLSLYAIFELVRFQKVLEKPYWFYIKATLVISGELFAIAAFLTGPEVEGAKLIEMHEAFAMVAIAIFGLIALGYLSKHFSVLKVFSFVTRSYILIPLAFLGLVSITITGGLGGAIVYGTDFDPFMAPIFKILGVY